MSVVIVGVIRRKPVLTHASIVCEGMLASVNSVNSVKKTLSNELRKVDILIIYLCKGASFTLCLVTNKHR